MSNPIANFRKLYSLGNPATTGRNDGLFSFVAEVDRRLSVVEELEAVVFANLKRAAHLRQSILQQAFSGTL